MRRSAEFAPNAARPLRFLLITTFYPPYSFGGDAVHVQLLAHALADAGHSVDVVHCIDSFRALGGRATGESAARRPGLRVHGLESGFGSLSPLLSQQIGAPHLKSRALRRIVAQCQPDVIHFHNVSLFGPEVMSLGAPAPTLKLYTAHEYWLVCPTHMLWKYDRQPCEARECLRCMLRARRPPQLWRHTRMLERSASSIDAFLAPSRYTAAMHARHGFSRPMLYFPLFTGVSQGAALPPAPHQRAFCLYAGRLEAYKNVHTLIAAWQRIEGVDLLIAGTGSEEAQLRASAATNPRVRFLGQLPQAELAAYYRHSVAAIVPSAWYEVFPMVVLEAFAQGAPVIAHDIGALAEMIEGTGGGLLYRNEDELVAAVSRVAAAPETRAALGACGRRAVEGSWSASAFMTRYFALLRSTAQRRFGTVPWEGSDRCEQALPLGHDRAGAEFARAGETRDTQ